MLYRGVNKEVNPSTKLKAYLLDAREAEWTGAQKIKMKERIEEKMKKTSKVNDIIKRLLNDCKSWNGPVTSCEELMKVLNERPGRQHFILRTELSYFSNTHRTDKIQRPDLYR